MGHTWKHKNSSHHVKKDRIRTSDTRRHYKTEVSNYENTIFFTEKKTHFPKKKETANRNHFVEQYNESYIDGSYSDSDYYVLDMMDDNFLGKLYIRNFLFYRKENNHKELEWQQYPQ